MDLALLLPLLLLRTASGFEVGKEYHYNYDGTVRITQPDIPTYAAGLAFRSKVVVQPQEDHTHFKVVDFNLDTVNGGDVNFDTHEFRYHSSPVLTEHIEKPFAVKFSNGKFENIETDRNEELWSQNLKQALASLFQVDLTHARSRGPHATQYNTFEESISGNCETLYYLSDNPTHRRKGHFEVTKVRNLQNCTYMSRALFGSFGLTKCDSCGAKEVHPLISSADAKYDLSGTPADFVVENVVATANHVFNPVYGGKVVELQERRSLRLTAVEDATTDTTPSEDSEVHTTLGGRLPTSTSLRDKEDLSKRNAFLAELNDSPNTTEFEEFFESLAQLHYGEDDYDDALRKESPALKFLRVYLSFYTFSRDETAGLFERVQQERPEEHEVPPEGEGRHPKEGRRSLFLNLLSASGCNQHISLAIRLVQDNKLTFKEVKGYINRLPFNTMEPSEAVLHGLIDLCELPFVKEHERLEGACLLTLGSLIESKCQRADTDDQEDGGLCKPEIVERFYDYTLGPVDLRNQSQYLTGVYMEVAGKLATRRAVIQLTRFVAPEVDCPELRLGALWALAHAGSSQRQLVRNAVLPIFVNTTESHPIRIAAFVAVASTRPDLYLFRHIARGIIDDPSDQVASYVTSFVREMAKSKHPCYAKWCRKLEHVTPIWEGVSRFAETPSHTTSRFILSSTYDEKYDYYSSTKTSIIMSEDSYLPLSIHSVKKDCVSGICVDTLSITYQGYGVDRVYAALASPRPGTKHNLWNFFGRRRAARSAEERQSIDNSLPITPRDFKPLSAHVKLNVWGHTLETWDLKETFADFFKEPAEQGESPAHKFINLLQRAEETKHFFVTPVMHFQIPADLGLPIYLELAQGNLLYVNRRPATFAQEDDKFQLDFQRHYLIDTSQYSYFGIGLPFDEAHLGTGYDKRSALSLPLHLRATYDMTTHKLKLERPLPRLPFDLFNYHFNPYSALGYYNGTISTQEQEQATLYNDEELVSHNKTYLADFFGFGFDVKSRLFAKDLKKSLHHFWHDMDLTQKSFYLDVNPHWHPRCLSIQVVPAEKDTTHTIELDIGYKTYGPDDVERHSNFVSTEETPDNTTSLVLSVDLQYKGDSKNRTIRTELQVTHTRDLLKHWVRFYYDRSPFDEGESNHKKICLDTAVTFPEKKWQKSDDLAAFYRGSTVEAKANLAYGADCSQGSKIVFHGKYEHTDADAEEIEDIVSVKPQSKNRFKQNVLRRLYDKCLFYKQRGVPLNNFCIKYLYQSSRLGKLNLDVEYHNLTQLHRYLPSGTSYRHNKKHPGFFDTIFSHSRGTDGDLHVVSQVPSSEESHLSTHLVVTTADGQVFHHHHVPTYTHLLEPRVFHLLGYTNLQEYSTAYKHEYCDLQGHSVRTFDGVLTQLPGTDCYAVVSRDCSPAGHFLILTKDTDSPTFPKALKLFIGNTIVDVLPSSEDLGAVLRVDGETVSVSSDHPYSHVTDGAELFSVESNGHFFRINSNSYGIYLYFRGRLLFLQVSPFYRGKLCGLCGDYNYDRKNEFRGPDKRLYNDSLEFAKSYVVPSEDCTL